MQELLLWQLLCAEQLDIQATIKHLKMTAQEPLSQRIVYFGLLSRCIHHPSSELRAAALCMLAGASGYQAHTWIVEKLHDPSEHVRNAALRVLYACSTEDETLRFYALFHEDPSIRQQAITLCPPQQVSQLLWHVSDTPHRPQVLQQLSRHPLEPDTLSVQLHLAAYHKVTTPEVFSWWSKLQWETKLSTYLHALPQQRFNPSLPHTLEELESTLTASTLGQDQLDTFWKLIWTELEYPSSLGHTAAHTLVERIVSAVHRHQLTQKEHTRIAVSAARVGFFEWFWEPNVLAMCAMVMPILLTHRMIPLQTRKQAAQQLAKGQQYTHRRSWLEDLLCSDLCYHANGALDLHTLSGCLYLEPQAPFTRALSYIRMEDLTQAVVRDPSSLVPLLHHIPQSQREERLQYTLLQHYSASEVELPLSIWAELLLILPSDRLHHLSPDAFSLAQWLQITRQLIHIIAQRNACLSNNKQRSIAALCSRLLPEHTCDVLSLWLQHVPLPSTEYSTLKGEDSEFEAEILDLCHTEFEAFSTQAHSPVLLFILEWVTQASVQLSITQWVAHLTQLPEQQQIQMLWLFTSSMHIPYALEQALGHAIQTSTNPYIQAWRRQFQAPVPADTLPTLYTLGSYISLPDALHHKLQTQTGVALRTTLEICYKQRVSGIADALRGRACDEPHLELCAALLISADSTEDIASVFERFYEETPLFRKQLDQLFVRRCEYVYPLSLVGDAWLSRWEKHRMAFYEALGELPHGIGEVLCNTLQLASPTVVIEIWKATERLFRQWRWREQTAIYRHVTIQCIERIASILLTTPKEHPLKAWASQPSTDLQVIAAHMLCILAELPHQPETLQNIRHDLVAQLPMLDEPVQKALQQWLNVRSVGRVASFSNSMDISTLPLETKKKIQTSCALDFLNKQLFETSHQAIEEAAYRLFILAESGQADTLHVLLDAFHSPKITSFAARILGNLLSIWPSDPVSVLEKTLQQLDPNSEEKRFILLQGLIDLDAIDPEKGLQHVSQSTQDNAWFTTEDWDRLCSLFEQRTLALALCTSRQYIAFSRSIQWLLDTPPDDTILATYIKILQSAHPMLHTYRLELAQTLWKNGRTEGLPILFTQHFVQQEETQTSRDIPPPDLFAQLTHEETYTLFDSIWIAGYKHTHWKTWCKAFKLTPSSAQLKQRVALQALRMTHNSFTHQYALDLLHSTPRTSDVARRVAQSFSWGVQTGREVTGKLFSFKMIGGDDLGYTRLESSQIYINPLPILRRERKGHDVVEGLIIHELGHHMYHADTEGIATWEQAQRENNDKLLNLVSDEQLERNLRAKSKIFGNKLKTLAAYAFQHARRDVCLPSLLRTLGAYAFETLHGKLRKVGRKKGHTHIQIGQLLLDLEAHGMSFARFVRALRMGLGNRHKDPKVERALRLFGKSFRHSSMPQMLEIARSLREIFEDDIQLLEMFSQEQTCQGDDVLIIETGEGIQDEEVQREIKKILNNTRATQSALETPPVRSINLSKEESFTRIHNIRTLPYDRTQYRQAAMRTMRWSRKMKIYLEGLGLQMHPQKKRLQGHRIDSAQVRSAVLRQDPRILIARKKHFATDLFLGVLIDCSGSMEINNNIQRAQLCATMLAEATRTLRGVETRFLGFTDTILYDAGTAQRCSVQALEAKGGNNDAAALHHMIQWAQHSRKRAKLLIMISDGSPTECSVSSLKNVVHKASTRMGICCAQIALRTIEHICFPHYIELLDDDFEKSIHQFGSIIRRLIHQTLR